MIYQQSFFFFFFLFFVTPVQRYPRKYIKSYNIIIIIIIIFYYFYFYYYINCIYLIAWTLWQIQSALFMAASLITSISFSSETSCRVITSEIDLIVYIPWGGGGVDPFHIQGRSQEFIRRGGGGLTFFSFQEIEQGQTLCNLKKVLVGFQDLVTP